MRCKLLKKVQRIASRACCKAAWERKEHSTRHHAGACRKLFEKVKKLKTITVSPSKTQETGGRLAGGRMAGCGRVAVWPCGHVAMWPCGRGRVAAWPGGRVAVVVAGWPGGRVAVAVAGPWPGWPATKKNYSALMHAPHEDTWPATSHPLHVGHGFLSPVNCLTSVVDTWWIQQNGMIQDAWPFSTSSISARVPAHGHGRKLWW